MIIHHNLKVLLLLFLPENDVIVGFIELSVLKGFLLLVVAVGAMFD